MTKKRYDLAFGFGIACSCSQSLRRAGLQYLSFPGDWTSPVAIKDLPRPNLVIRVDRLCRGLDGFFRTEDFKLKERNPEKGKDHYDNTRTFYTFPHDFPAGCDLEATLQKVRDKYRRRYQRLLALLRSSKRVLVARIDFPDGSRPTSIDDCRYARKRLSETFPNAAFDFVLLQPEVDVPFADRRISHPEPWLTRIAFDYRSDNPKDDKLIPNLALTSAALKAVATVRDYRTRQERADFKVRQRRKRWAKIGATTFREYLMRKVFRRFRRTYDLAFGMGISCNSSISLRKAGLQYLSFPGDWTSPVWKREELPEPNLVCRAHWLCRGLEGFLNPGDFTFVRKHEWNGKDVYANVRTHYLFPHDLPSGGDFAVEFPKMAAKYERRYNRLISLIRASKRVFVLRVDHPDQTTATAVEDCEKAHEELCRTFPDVTFDFALFQCDPKRPFPRRNLSHPRPWLTHVQFDYRSQRPSDDAKTPNNRLIAKMLKKLVKVRDYRTDAERAAQPPKKF